MRLKTLSLVYFFLFLVLAMNVNAAFSYYNESVNQWHGAGPEANTLTMGLKFIANQEMYIINVTKDSRSNINRVRLCDNVGCTVTYESATFSGDIAQFTALNHSWAKGETGYIISDNSGSGYSSYYVAGTFPKGRVNLNFTTAVYRGADNAETHDLYDVFTRNGTSGLPATITFISQTPANITSTSIFSENVNITFQFNDTLSQPLLNYTVYGGISCLQFINGTCVLLNNTMRTQNFSLNGSSLAGFTNYSFTLGENDIYASTNFLNYTYFNQQHLLYSTTNSNDYIAFTHKNVTGTYQVLEVMANVSAGGLARVYACNNSYTTGSALTSTACQEIGSLNSTTFNHTHSAFVSHNVVPFTIINSKIGGLGINVTHNMTFIIRRIAGTLDVYYIPNESYSGATMTSNNNGNTWTAQTYTIDSHIHFWTGTENLTYQATSTTVLSSPVTELIDVSPLNPTPPIITRPLGDYLQNASTMNITWTNATVNAPGALIYFYNISLLNEDLSFNQTIRTNVSLNNSFLWNVFNQNLSLGAYNIQVCAKDSLAQIGCDQEPFNLTANAQLNITAYNGSTLVTTFNVNLTDRNNGTIYNYSTTTGFITLNMVKGYNYTVTLDANNYALMTTNQSINASYIGLNFSLFDNNRLDILIYNELTSALILENITITMQSNDSLMTYNTLTGGLNITSITPSEYIITFTSVNYTTRSYVLNIQNRTYQSLSARLLGNNDSIAVGVYTKTQSFQVLANVLMTIQRQYSGGSYATIYQGYTDVSGFSVFYVEEGTSYRVILSAGGYSTRQFSQAFYTANSPYTFILTELGSTPYINIFNGVNYYYSPTNTTQKNESITFSITTYNSSFTIAWTAVNANGLLTNVSGSPGGATASRTVDLTGYSGKYPVVYSWNYYDPNTETYQTYQIPINYYINNGVAYTNMTLPESLTNLKDDIDNDGWIAILAVFFTLGAVVTVVQLSGNVLAGIATGFGSMIFFAVIGWLPGMLVAFIVLISGFLLFMERSY